MEFLENLRYDRPILFRGLVVTVSVVVFASMFASLPENEFFRTIGVTKAQKRCGALYHAAFWHMRAVLHQDSEGDKPHVVYGNMVGIDKNGQLVILTPSGDKFVQSTVRLADTALVDLYGAAASVAKESTADARFDIYNDKEVVVWIRSAPFNVQLIEEGHAKPDPRPPTNIVDKAFAAYYWRIWKGN